MSWPLHWSEVAVLDSNSEALGVSQWELMQSAAEQLAEQAKKMLPEGGSVLILCGPGNNGGDGYAAALELSKSNINVKVHSLYSIDEYKGDLLDYYLKCYSSNISITFGIDLPL